MRFLLLVLSYLQPKESAKVRLNVFVSTHTHTYINKQIYTSTYSLQLLLHKSSVRAVTVRASDIFKVLGVNYCFEVDLHRQFLCSELTKGV